MSLINLVLAYLVCLRIRAVKHLLVVYSKCHSLHTFIILYAFCAECSCNYNCHMQTIVLGLTPISSSETYHNLYHKVPYLRERVTQLQPLMDELDPYEPVNFPVYRRLFLSV